MWRFCQMFVLNHGVLWKATCVSSSQRPGHRDHGHLDVRSFVNVHANGPLDHQEEILIFEGGAAT
ncbi:MAG: hypothetical protein OK454_07745 [Thaumarchaeota archaeon]|nr:hypothetical protein [Nitrososphaerota archaeon]